MAELQRDHERMVNQAAGALRDHMGAILRAARVPAVSPEPGVMFVDPQRRGEQLDIGVHSQALVRPLSVPTLHPLAKR